MGLFSNKKKLCPVCGEPTPRLFPTKVAGDAICKACDKKIYIGYDKVDEMSLEEFLQYISFYDENQTIRDSFHATYECHSANVFLDETNKMFRLKNDDKAPVFYASCLKGFRILEDEDVLFESQGNVLRVYESMAPMKVRQMAGIIGEFRARMQEYEFRKQLEEKRERMAEQRGEEYHKDIILRPTLGCDEPFGSFWVELELEHPYWSEFRAEVCGPRFSYDYPSVDGYICDYENEAGRMHELAMNLMQMICPGAQEVRDTDVNQINDVTRQNPMTSANDAVEEIKKYKELLDAGIITEEEFAAKKRQLMGL